MRFFLLPIILLSSGMVLAQSYFEGEILYKVDRAYPEGEIAPYRLEAHEALYPDSMLISIKNDSVLIVKYGSRLSSKQTLYVGDKDYSIDYSQYLINIPQRKNKQTYKEYKRKTEWYRSLKNKRLDSTYMEKPIRLYSGFYSQGGVTDSVWYWKTPVNAETGNVLIDRDKGIALLRKQSMEVCSCIIQYKAIRINEKKLTDVVFALPENFTTRDFYPPPGY